ncbi:MAG: hypothetical protein CK425_05615 [Parachlamydia sp.]|nr:MAG: hypothetical protein CK425_05615 [Parachlamydia sp.]
MKAFRFLLCVLTCLVGTPSIHATYVYKDGCLVNANEVSSYPLHVHYNLGVAAYQKQNWGEAVKQFNLVTVNYPTSEWAQEAFFFLGVANYELAEYDFANEAFTQYLSAKSCPEHFDEAIEYKFAVAEQFRGGAKRHVFGTKQLPKWATGQAIALEIYDEVIAAAPAQEIAARALYSKGLLLWEQKDYRESVDSFYLLVRRFPKHELAPESYLVISQVYLDQARSEFQNPDLLALAQVNLQRFERDFPNEERLKESAADVLKIKEVYANGLFQTASFYERTGRPEAASIYYKNAMAQFPGTTIAEYCQRRLHSLAKDKS